jgi:hypothetical protein
MSKTSVFLPYLSAEFEPSSRTFTEKKSFAFYQKLTLIFFEKNSQKTKTAHPYNLNGQMRKIVNWGEDSLTYTNMTPTAMMYSVLLSYKTPWPLVRKRTIPTKQLPLVSEVSANFCG